MATRSARTCCTAHPSRNSSRNYCSKIVVITPLISMSLGTSSSSDGTDVVSQAVNRAADAGIVPVIAAGNSGPAKYTIGSPGAASGALTVAAMSDPAQGGFGLASFSSRGPTQDNRMKPEISAPGVSIMSCKANSGNQYISFSGTSMATPFDILTLRPPTQRLV
ncbi:MAG TPA: S8 family serine peptidase [Symbiobacteriaceae bacterium]